MDAFCPRVKISPQTDWNLHDTSYSGWCWLYSWAKQLVWVQTWHSNCQVHGPCLRCFYTFSKHAVDTLWVGLQYGRTDLWELTISRILSSLVVCFDGTISARPCTCVHVHVLVQVHVHVHVIGHQYRQALITWCSVLATIRDVIIQEMTFLLVAIDWKVLSRLVVNAVCMYI